MRRKNDTRRLTPLRALELLRKLERHQPPPTWLVDETCTALADHVKSAITRRRGKR